MKYITMTLESEDEGSRCFLIPLGDDEDPDTVAQQWAKDWEPDYYYVGWEWLDGMGDIYELCSF